MIQTLIMFLLFVLSVICVTSGVTNKIDVKFSEFVISRRKDSITKIMKFFTNIGNGYLAFILISLMFIFTDRSTIAVPISVSAGLAIISSRVLKRVIKRNRPEGNRLVEETDYSFPSYHTVGIVGLLFPAMIFINAVHPEYVVVVSVVCIFVMFNVSFSRIYLGVHYLMDIVGGATWACFVTYFVKMFI